MRTSLIFMIGLLISKMGHAQMPLPCFDVWTQSTLSNFIGEWETRCLLIDAQEYPIQIDDNSTRQFVLDEGVILANEPVSLMPGSEQGGFSMRLRPPSDDIEGVWYEPMGSYEVPMYDKVEWGIALPADIEQAISNWISNEEQGTSLTPSINPFNPEEIDVWAEVIAPGSAEPQIVYGFYYRPFERIWSGNNPSNLSEMDDPDNWFRQPLPNPHPFRFRYAPVAMGMHLVQLKMRLADGTTFESVTFPFLTSYRGPEEGFIGLSQNKRYFAYANGDVFFPVGPQLFPATCECNRIYQPSNAYPVDGGGVPNVNFETDCNECYWNGSENYCCGLDEFITQEGFVNPVDWRGSFWRGQYNGVENETEHMASYLETLRYIEAAAAAGANSFRTMLSPIAYDFEFEKLNNYYDRQFMAWELDQLIEKANAFNLRIDLNLMLHTNLTASHNVTWDWTDEINNNDEPAGSTPDYHCGDEDYEMQYGMGNCYYTYREQTNCDTEPVSFMRETASKMYYKRKLRYFIARYGYSKNIYLLELMSEANNLGIREDRPWQCSLLNNPSLSYVDSPVTRRIVGEWHIEMAEYIKNELGHRKHLLAADYTGIPEHGNEYFLYSFTVAFTDPNFDRSWSAPIIDVIGTNSYTNEVNRYEQWADLDNEHCNWLDFMHLYVEGSDLNALAPYYMITKPVIHPELGWGDLYMEIDNSGLIRDLWASAFAGFASSGCNWSDRTPSQNWQYYDNVIGFLQTHLFSQISVSTTNEWRIGYEHDDNKRAEVIYMYRSGDDPKAVGMIVNLNYNPTNVCELSDWPFLDLTYNSTDERLIRAIRKHYNEENGFNNKDYYINESGESFELDVNNPDSPLLRDMGWCDTYEINYFHPWSQAQISTETDETSLFNDRMRLKNIPTLTESVPFVLFTVHRTGSCAQGFFGMEGPEFVLSDSTAIRDLEPGQTLLVENNEGQVSSLCNVIPNPTNGMVYIRSTEPLTCLSLYNDQGAIMDQIYNPAESHLSLENYASGLYHLRVQTTQGVYVFKIVKL